MDRNRTLTLITLEMVCGVAWFLDDGFWLMGWRWPCYAACAIAILFATAIPFYLPRRMVPMLVCGADSCWLAFNVFWSVGDLEAIVSLNTVAKVLFFAGMVFFVSAACAAAKVQDAFSLILSRVRFFRFWT